MADIADDADRHVDYFLKEAFAKLRVATLAPTGLCHYCMSEVGVGALFCEGPDCRNDYDREQKLKKLHGK